MASTLLPPDLKSFSLTHILYDPTHPKHISLPLTLLSLSPIFLFVSYFTLVVFDRRLVLLNLAIGSVVNEILSWGLKRIWKGDRPFAGHHGLGDGYGMPSSHSQAAGFLVAWGLGYVLTMDKRGGGVDLKWQGIRKLRTGVYLFGLILWSLLTAYSRYYLLYHTPFQVVAGYTVGLLFGAFEFCLTEFLPLYRPNSLFGRLRRIQEWLWVSIGGVGGWNLGGSSGGWGEGKFFAAFQSEQSSSFRSHGPSKRA